MPRRTEADLAAFFQQAEREHATAVGLTSAEDRTLRFADTTVRLRFAGRALADRLLPALTPRLDATAVPPHATIRLWEGCRIPGGRLRVPWLEGEVGPRGLVQGGGGGYLAVQEAGSGALTVAGGATRDLLYRVPEAGRLPWWERAAPLRPALFWALSGPDRHLVHAGAVGDHQRGGALVAGAGGSGKTTVALAALAVGFRYLADDYLLLDISREPVAWNLYGTAKLDDGHLARFPKLSAAARCSSLPEPDEKAVLDVAASQPGALAESLPVRAVIVPRIRGGRATLRRISGAEALLALAPSTALQMPFDDGAVVRSLARLVRRIPCFALDVGDRPAELAEAVDRVLETTSSPEADRSGLVSAVPPRVSAGRALVGARPEAERR